MKCCRIFVFDNNSAALFISIKTAGTSRHAQPADHNKPPRKVNAVREAPGKQQYNSKL